MMNLLIAAATPLEITPLLEYLQPYRVDHDGSGYKWNSLHIKICITGIGCMSAAYTLGKCLSAQWAELAIQAGIAGAFPHDIGLGNIMRIKSDLMADLGAEDHGRFTDLFEMGFLNPEGYPYSQKKLIAPELDLSFLKDLPEANAITVNTVSGKQDTILKWTEKYHPDLESMEGAAFHYVCLMEKVKFVQVRSISNYVEIRDKSKWNIPLAVKNLNEFLIEGLNHMASLRQ